MINRYISKYLAISLGLILCSCSIDKVVVNREVESQKYGKLLLGQQMKEQFLKEPFRQWFENEKEAYHPDAEIIKSLKKENINSTKIFILIGTWDTNSQKELPKIIKVLEEIKFPDSRLEIIAVNDKYQSPSSEEVIFNIQKIPTIIVRRYGKDLGRVTLSETDNVENALLDIFSKNKNNR
jgi:thioredoxin family protein